MWYLRYSLTGYVMCICGSDLKPFSLFLFCAFFFVQKSYSTNYPFNTHFTNTTWRQSSEHKISTVFQYYYTDVLVTIKNLPLGHIQQYVMINEMLVIKIIWNNLPFVSAG